MASEKTKANAGSRVSKPLMEKKRRARINRSLEQLKSLLESYYSSNIRKRKLEKADILELTVKHLKHLHRIHTCAAAAASELSDYQLGFRGCLANVNQYLLTADNVTGSDRWMLATLSSTLCRSLGRGEGSSTTDSGLDTAPPRDEVQRVLPSGAGPEHRSTAKSKAMEHSSASRSPRVPGGDAPEPLGTKRTAGSAALAQNPLEKRSSSKTPRPANHGNEDANVQHNVWRPW